MNLVAKQVDQLTEVDIQESPVWEFVQGSGPESKLMVHAVETLPVKHLMNRLVATQVSLRNGIKFWSLIGNIDPNDVKWNENFLTISLFRSGSWFNLARYHDYHALSHGPDALSKFLGYSVDDVFPMTYDISEFCSENIGPVSGKILIEPLSKLTESEIIKIAIIRARKCLDASH